MFSTNVRAAGRLRLRRALAFASGLTLIGLAFGACNTREPLTAHQARVDCDILERMRREIGQVPATVERILAGADEVETVAAAVRRAQPRWVTIAARGTSTASRFIASFASCSPRRGRSRA